MLRGAGVVLWVVALDLVVAPVAVHALADPVPDERAEIEAVTAFHDKGDALRLLVCPTRRWEMTPPVLYSLMFEVTMDMSEQNDRYTVVVGWQTHDGETRAFGTGPDGEFEPAAYITLEGCVLFDLPQDPDTIVTRAQGDFASWEDANTSQPAYGTIPIEIVTLSLQSAEPITVAYDLNQNEPVATTTTTTATPAETTVPTEPASGGTGVVTTASAATITVAVSSPTEAPADSSSGSGWWAGGVVALVVGLLSLLLLLWRWSHRNGGPPPTPPPQNNDFGA